MELVNLPGVQLTLQQPRVVAESVGYCWYPDILKFPSGELMLIYSLNPDSNESLFTAQAVFLSQDKGQTWRHAYDINGFHNGAGEIRFNLADGAIVSPSSYPMHPDPAGQWRRFTGHYWRFENGGRKYSVEAGATTIEGLPRDVKARTVWSRWDWASLCLFGDSIEVEKGRFVTTCYLNYVGDKRSSLITLVSTDEGHTWRYLSTIAGQDSVTDAKEGCDESCMIQLADGDLMCVSRVGSGREQYLARTYSSDGGKSWSGIDRLPAWSVAPTMVRLANGTIVLSTGRPGLFLWFSTDPRGKDWQPFDVQTYHNSALDASQHIHTGKGGFNVAEPSQTTAYTALVEIAPNRLILAYDRMPFGWMPVPTENQIRSRIMEEYPIVSLQPDAITAPEREQIYLLEMDVQR